MVMRPTVRSVALIDTEQHDLTRRVVDGEIDGSGQRGVLDHQLTGILGQSRRCLALHVIQVGQATRRAVRADDLALEAFQRLQMIKPPAHVSEQQKLRRRENLIGAVDHDDILAIEQ